MVFEGQAEEVVVRTTTGDLGILAGHINCVAPLGMGRATIITEGKKRYAACIGGLISVNDGSVNLVPTTFEWAENIDAARAEAAYQRAQNVLKDKSASQTDVRLAQARLHRALVRKSVASDK
jgi:F-type H+-transporting ATPase subunit epsilon